MKTFWRTLLTVIIIIGAFFLGINLGKNRVKSKIPKFQEDIDSSY
ncbi:MAG: hypothetical protein N3B16_00985 [Candidatus Aminicenantes bacterium]|nr:hypothetical protein [Candidatus Aminicenantes bacterium]